MTWNHLFFVESRFCSFCHGSPSASWRLVDRSISKEAGSCCRVIQMLLQTKWRSGSSTQNSQLLDINMWANYNDLTATSLESWKIRRIIPRWPYFWLVNYCNLPGYLSGCIQESIDTLWIIMIHWYLCSIIPLSYNI